MKVMYSFLNKISFLKLKNGTQTLTIKAMRILNTASVSIMTKLKLALLNNKKIKYSSKIFVAKTKAIATQKCTNLITFYFLVRS